MYKSVIRNIPVAWLLEVIGFANAIFNIIGSIFERIGSFFGTVFWNLAGLDAYYVFIDENPVPVHYPKFMIGGIYEKLWFYNIRSREFTFGQWTDTQREYLPAITGTYRCLSEEQDISFDITEFLNRASFKTFPGVFPTPMQLVGAWSLHSGIWPSMMGPKAHTLTVMNGFTGDDVEIALGLTAAPFRWASMNGDSDDEEDTDATSEETGHPNSDNETVADDLVEKDIKEMNEAVEEMESKSKELHEEGDILIQKIFEELNKSCISPTFEYTINETKETVEEAVEETKDDEEFVKKIEEVAEELDSKYSQQTVEDKDLHVIQDSEYFEKVD